METADFQGSSDLKEVLQSSGVGEQKMPKSLKDVDPQGLTGKCGPGVIAGKFI